MTYAIEEAEKALALGEIPVGAVIVRGGEVISRGHNLCETLRDATLHAEILAIRRASEVVGDWRLCGCDIYVTLEPCSMCAGAILNSRLDRLIFGAYDPERGAAGGRLDLFARHSLGGRAEVYGGIMQRECEAMLNGFFKNMRK